VQQCHLQEGGWKTHKAAQAQKHTAAHRPACNRCLIKRGCYVSSCVLDQHSAPVVHMVVMVGAEAVVTISFIKIIVGAVE
jgi:hypothetical protein